MKIKKKVAEQFFEFTNTDVDYLEKWLKRNLKSGYYYPCVKEEYNGYSLFVDRNSASTYQRTDDLRICAPNITHICVPNITNEDESIWEVLKGFKDGSITIKSFIRDVRRALK